MAAGMPEACAGRLGVGAEHLRGDTRSESKDGHPETQIRSFVGLRDISSPLITSRTNKLPARLQRLQP